MPTPTPGQYVAEARRRAMSKEAVDPLGAIGRLMSSLSGRAAGGVGRAGEAMGFHGGRASRLARAGEGMVDRSKRLGEAAHLRGATTRSDWARGKRKAGSGITDPIYNDAIAEGRGASKKMLELSRMSGGATPDELLTRSRVLGALGLAGGAGGAGALALGGGDEPKWSGGGLTEIDDPDTEKQGGLTMKPTFTPIEAVSLVKEARARAHRRLVAKQAASVIVQMRKQAGIAELLMRAGSGMGRAGGWAAQQAGKGLERAGFSGAGKSVAGMGERLGERSRAVGEQLGAARNLRQVRAGGARGYGGAEQTATGGMSGGDLVPALERTMAARRGLGKLGDPSELMRRAKTVGGAGALGAAGLGSMALGGEGSSGDGQ